MSWEGPLRTTSTPSPRGRFALASRSTVEADEFLSSPLSLPLMSQVMEEVVFYTHKYSSPCNRPPEVVTAPLWTGRQTWDRPID
jgi:hypothetical protein